MLFNTCAPPAELYKPENAPLLTGILRGVEREALRTTWQGMLAQSPHPEGLGSALTHPLITTDFSEALLEFITAPTHCIEQLFSQLEATHRFTQSQLAEDELLWTHSMPCMLGEEHNIPVAQYGQSHNGNMKTVYRKGLGHRYGRRMQTVAGVHYNFSLPKAFWAFLHRHDNSLLDLQHYSDARHFGLIRNFRRHYWLLIYLFGASPAICESFIGPRAHAAKAHALTRLAGTEHTLHLPFATSLRMGDLGYQSSAQESLHICYNSPESYIRSLCCAITQTHPAYAALGIKDSQGEYKQLSTGLLQIENEFYSAVRPKRSAHPGETALSALGNRGVEYIEVRSLDVNPDNPLGLDRDQVHFLDTFLLFCALQPSPNTTTEEAALILANQKLTVNKGREPNLQLHDLQQGKVALTTWGSELIDAMQDVAELLDTVNHCQHHQTSLAKQKAKLIDSERTPSAKMLATLSTLKCDYHTYANERAKAHKAELETPALCDSEIHHFETITKESKRKQAEMEKAQNESFDEFLQSYYKQYSNCASKD